MQGLFRDLDPDEVVSFQRWARDHWYRDIVPSDLWHPVVRAELARLTSLPESEIDAALASREESAS